MLSTWHDLLPREMERLKLDRKELVKLFGGVRDDWIATDLKGWLAPNRQGRWNELLSVSVHALMMTSQLRSLHRGTARCAKPRLALPPCFPPVPFSNFRFYEGTVSPVIKALASKDHELYIVTTKQVSAVDKGLFNLACRTRLPVDSWGDAATSPVPCPRPPSSGPIHRAAPDRDGRHPLPRGPHLLTDGERGAQVGPTRAHPSGPGGGGQVPLCGGQAGDAGEGGQGAEPGALEGEERGDDASSQAEASCFMSAPRQLLEGMDCNSSVQNIVDRALC